jgi:hypothetical protein
MSHNPYEHINSSDIRLGSIENLINNQRNLVQGRLKREPEVEIERFREMDEFDR